MRKSLLFGAMLLFASCTVQKEEEFESPLLHRYHAVMEEPVDAETRVYADSKLRVHWNEGDHISIFERKTYNQEYEFLGDNGDTAGDFDPVESSGYHTGGDIEDGHVYAIYPYDKKNKCDYEGKLTVTFPSAQHYKKDSFGIGANIMVARTNTMDLNFMHLGGYRTFKLYGEGVSVSSIRIESNGPEFLSGRTDVIIGSDGKPAVSFIESETNSKSIELVCDTPVALGGTAAEAVEFWFVLPPCTLTQGFTVTITDNNGGVFTKATSNSIEIKSGVKKSMSAFEVKPVISVTGIYLNKTELTLAVGAIEHLTASVLPENATDKTVTWSISDGSVAAVDAEGNVTALKVGSAVITATAGEMTAECSLTIIPVAVTGVTLDKEELMLKPGETSTLTATVLPENAANKSVTWTSSNTSIATVDANGIVTAKSVGTATVTVTTTDGGKTATCSVIVDPITVTSVSLNKTTLSLIKGGTETLVATIIPSNATDQTVIWTSSNTSVATVDSSGKVTAISGGSATITASVGGMTATCAVTVTAPVTGVSLNKASLSLTKGSTETLTATITPSDATNKTVTWSSSNTAVATVDSNGKVTAVAGGTATITVKTSDGNKTATCAVTVTVPVTGVSLNKSSMTLSGMNATGSLTATVTPTDATDKNVIWSSSNTSVATVSDGIVFAKGGGTTMITVTTVDGNKTATCEVTVIIPVTSVTLNRTTLSIAAGSTYRLSATVAPDNATDRTVTWTTSNSAVAEISNNGLVRAKTAGMATITAQAGTKSATCEVTVTSVVEPSYITLNASSLLLAVNETYQLEATVFPENATDKTVTWSVNETAVSVSDNGLVKGRTPNYEVTVTATTSNGRTATCIVQTIKTRSYPIYYDATQKFESFHITNQSNANVAAVFGNVYDSNTQTGVLYCNEQPVYIDVLPGQYTNPNKEYLTGITIPSGGVTIAGSAFMNCSNLGRVSLPNDLVRIGDGAFANCHNLTSIVIPEGITTIGQNTFWGCSSLTSVTLPSTLTSIGQSAFSNCTSLVTLTIPVSLTQLGRLAFSGCTNLSSFTQNAICPDGRGIVIDRTLCFVAPFGITSYTVPSGVTTLATYCLDSAITEIKLPASITTMTACDFYNWNELTLTIKATTPPAITSSSEYFDSDLSTSELKIIVPRNSLSAYQNDTNWAKWKRYMQAGNF